MSDKKNKALKPGWRWVKFGDVVRQCKEKANPETSGLERYIAGDHMDTDDLRLRRWGEIGSGYLGPAFHMRFKPGQVLYGSRRTYLRKVALAEFDGICANTTFVLESKSPDELLPGFLPFLMQADAFTAFSVKNSKGSVNPYINFSDLARFEFALPPMAEQAKYCEALNAHESTLRFYGDLIASMKSLARSSTNSIITSSSDVVAEIIRFSNSSELNLRDGWSMRTAAEICRDPVTSGSTPRDGITEINTGRPFLRVQNLSFDGQLDFSSEKYLEADSFESTKKTHVQPGDVLTNIVGPPLGKVSVIPDGFPEAQINQAIVRFRPKDRILGRYLSYYLMSDFAKSWLFSRSKKTSGQRNINTTTCASLPVPIPPDNLIADTVKLLDDCFDLLKQIERRRVALQNVKIHLLEKATGGPCVQ